MASLAVACTYKAGLLPPRSISFHQSVVEIQMIKKFKPFHFFVQVGLDFFASLANGISKLYVW